MPVTMRDLMGMQLTRGQQRGGGLMRQTGGGPQRQIQTTYNPSQARRDTDSGVDDITYQKKLLEEAKIQNALLAEEDKRLDLLYPTEGLETPEQTQSRVALRDLLGTQGLQERVSAGMSLDPETGEYRPTYTVQPSGMMGPSRFEGMTRTQQRQALTMANRSDLIKLLVPEKYEAKSPRGKLIADKEFYESIGDIEAVRSIEEVIATGSVGGKVAQNYLLPNGQVVLSFDGGRTYMTEGGTEKIPFDAMKVPATTGLRELQAGKIRGAARKAVGTDIPETVEDVEAMAKLGTGPYAFLATAIEALAGGLGADYVFGKNGIFPNVAESRQTLRAIRQLGKEALLNSARGAIWEQEKINELFPDPDKIFVNPRVEAGKFDVMRKKLEQEKAYNNKAISNTATPPKMVEKLLQSNYDIDRLFAIIGTGEEEVTTLTMPDGSIQKFDKAGKRIE